MLSLKKLKYLFHGFTLVELIVVISVLAVLATIAMTQVSNITAWARDSQRMTDMSAMKSSIELYKATTGKLPIPTNGSGVTYSWGLLWTQGTFGEPTWRQLNSITPKPIDPISKIEYVYSVANNNREFELGGILEKATGLAPSLFPELLAASQNITFIEWTYNGVSLKVETGSKVYVVAAPSLIGGYLWDTKMENTGLTIEWLGSLPLGFSGAVTSTAQTGTFTPKVVWSDIKLPETAAGTEAIITGLQNAYTGSNATSLSQISSLVNATGSQITALGAGLVENALGGDISGQGSGGGEGTYCSNPTVVTTLAGSNFGFANGTGTNASFKTPYGVSVDGNGNVYVSDMGNYLVRKITPAGLVTTLAGNGYTDFLDGTWTSAGLYTVSGMSTDSNGNIYVAGNGHHAIRKITPAGVVTTLAGNGTLGTADGLGNIARFNNPYGVAVDSNGNIYVADSSNNRIRKVTPEGLVSTLAGSTSGYTDATGVSAQFANPQGIAVDSNGTVYVADTGNHRIRKVTPEGAVTTLAGSTSGYTDAVGTSAQFYSPGGMVTDKNGNIYVGDINNYRVRKITPTGAVTTLAGSTSGYADGTGTLAKFSSPAQLAIDVSGNLYVADVGNNRIRKISCQ